LKPEEMTRGEAGSVYVRRQYVGFDWSIESVIGVTMDLVRIGLVVPVGDLVWAYILGLEGSRRAHCRRKTCRVVSSSLKMNMDSAACRVAVTGRIFAVWNQSREAKLVTAVHSVGDIYIYR
jgi:hypothetical protein